MSELSKRQIARLRKRLRAEVDRKLAELGKAERIEPPTKEWAVLLALRTPKAFVEEAAKEYLAGGETPVSRVFERHPEWRDRKREADERIADLAKKRNNYRASLLDEVAKIVDSAIFCGNPGGALLALEMFKKRIEKSIEPAKSVEVNCP